MQLEPTVGVQSINFILSTTPCTCNRWPRTAAATATELQIGSRATHCGVLTPSPRAGLRSCNLSDRGLAHGRSLISSTALRQNRNSMRNPELFGAGRLSIEEGGADLDGAGGSEDLLPLPARHAPSIGLEVGQHILRHTRSS
eukprot:598926-Rhodomonas_salina.1